MQYTAVLIQFCLSLDSQKAKYVETLDNIFSNMRSNLKNNVQIKIHDQSFQHLFQFFSHRRIKNHILLHEYFKIVKFHKEMSGTFQITTTVDQ